MRPPALRRLAKSDGYDQFRPARGSADLTTGNRTDLWMPTIRVFNYRIPVPASRLARIVVAILLIIGGILGFLPILGFWMIPAGLLILAIDSPRVRRWNRQMTVRLVRWWRARRGRRTSVADGER